MRRIAFLLLNLVVTAEKSIGKLKGLLNNEDIRNTWDEETLKMCVDAENFQPKIVEKLNCEIVFTQLFEPLKIEYYARRPPLLRIHDFGHTSMAANVKKTFYASTDVESAVVEGAAYSPGRRGRIADGLWLEHHEECVKPLFKKLQQSLRVNPAIAENFMIMKYDAYGHYAPHYDHLDPMPHTYDDGWYEFFGNRMATALFVAQAAEEGGGTVFPKLKITVVPKKNDLIVWFNSDSNDSREYKALHAACPVIKGTKIVVSLWIRGNFQDQLQSPPSGPAYNISTLVKTLNSHKSHPQYDSRPQIPREFGGYWDDEEE